MNSFLGVTAIGTTVCTKKLIGNVLYDNDVVSEIVNGEKEEGR